MAEAEVEEEEAAAEVEEAEVVKTVRAAKVVKAVRTVSCKGNKIIQQQIQGGKHQDTLTYPHLAHVSAIGNLANPVLCA